MEGIHSSAGYQLHDFLHADGDPKLHARGACSEPFACDTNHRPAKQDVEGLYVPHNS
jgi:hypothetical protein